ncbi:replication endonuclease [Chitiniphilus purpureus]|uniref:Replication endonuclease n=1 Tax=Chitiniphilus purpureus TaxID=2981137 RepID=A0ABY6DQP1_9NEIS|nr:replication endonuclease [Chitiniphilus sp. CD1]UXY16695.1 replication endonuclease [Chitiniphilus sp. CD1]
MMGRPASVACVVNTQPLPHTITKLRDRVRRQERTAARALLHGLPEELAYAAMGVWIKRRGEVEVLPGRDHFNGAESNRRLVAANCWAREFATRLRDTGLPLDKDDDELSSMARVAADECARILVQAETGEVFRVRDGERFVRRPRYVIEAWLKAEAAGIVEPLHELTEKQRAYVVRRLGDEKFWRGRLKRRVTGVLEHAYVCLGEVKRTRSAYLSQPTYRRLCARARRNRLMLAAAEATNETGYTATLEELSKRNVSNPAIRRTELMVRARGMEEVAKAAGLSAWFITLTAPSKYHPSSDKYGKAGHPRFTARDVQDYLCALWARARAQFKKHAISPFGIRVAEPHHDGCPHWHLLLWVAKDRATKMLAILRAKALEEDGTEAGAADHRMTVEAIDPRKGSAVGYISKYLAKNIDGHRMDTDDESGLSAEDGADRVAKWASNHRIRQFQTLGTPPVTIWRELRKADLFASENEMMLRELHRAADMGDWAMFMRAWCAIGSGYRVTFEHEQEACPNTGEQRLPSNRFGEPVLRRAAVVVRERVMCGRRVVLGEVVERVQTKLHSWSIEWGRRALADCEHQQVDAFQRSGVAASTWTCVNNCNQPEATARQVARLERQNADSAVTWRRDLELAITGGTWDRAGRWKPAPASGPAIATSPGFSPPHVPPDRPRPSLH